MASANLGVLGGLSDDEVDVEPVDDFREGVRLRAEGRLLSSCGAIVLWCDVKREEVKERTRPSQCVETTICSCGGFRNRVYMYTYNPRIGTKQYENKFRETSYREKKYSRAG